ncbi:hypothetical protein [Roseivirga pacifica]|uniref:hypothetical protein n=1 Tax=Roseivirga pacifica TaxID=1267423 RepID=UPI003BA9430B
MKKLLLLILLIPFFVQAQDFSGEITYEIRIVPKSDTIGIDTSGLKELIAREDGTTVSYIIGAKRYKSTYYKDGKYSYSYTYDNETKRMYDDYAGKPYITFRDARKPNYEYGDSEILEDATTKVLGHESYMVITESEYGLTKTYYSEDIRVDYTDFEGHNVGNWYNKLKEVDGAIALKTTTEYGLYYEIREAVKIKKRKVKDKEFELPDKPIAAAFSALDEKFDLLPPTQAQLDCYQEKTVSNSKSGGEKYTSYITFILETDGTMKYAEPLEEDKDGLYKVALDIVLNCGFQFKIGKIDGKPVNTQIHFPVEFLR